MASRHPYYLVMVTETSTGDILAYTEFPYMDQALNEAKLVHGMLKDGDPDDLPAWAGNEYYRIRTYVYDVEVEYHTHEHRTNIWLNGTLYTDNPKTPRGN